MLVSWKEKPTPSPPSTMRLLRQPWPATSRSVPVISAVLRTIISTLLSANGADRAGQHSQTMLDLLIGDRQWRQQFHHFVQRTGGLHQQPALEGDLADLAGLGGIVEDHTVHQSATPRRNAREVLGRLG